MEPDVRTIAKSSIAWRIAVAMVGIGLLLNGSLRMSDDVWPFGPLSQYAFSPPADATIVITRVEGRLADGRRIDLPLRVESAGISRAEIEARIPEITSDPSLLRSVVDGWTRRHPGEPGSPGRPLHKRGANFWQITPDYPGVPGTPGH